MYSSTALGTGIKFFLLTEGALILSVVMWSLFPYPLLIRMGILLWLVHIIILLPLMFLVFQLDQRLSARSDAYVKWRAYLLTAATHLLPVLVAWVAVMLSGWIEAPPPRHLPMAMAIGGTAVWLVGPTLFSSETWTRARHPLLLPHRLMVLSVALALFVAGTVLYVRRAEELERFAHDGLASLENARRTPGRASIRLPVYRGVPSTKVPLPIWARTRMRSSQNGFLYLPSVDAMVVYHRKGAMVEGLLLDVPPYTFSPVSQLVLLLGALVVIMAMMVTAGEMARSLKKVEYHLKAVLSGLLDKEIDSPAVMDEFAFLLDLLDRLRKTLRDYLSEAKDTEHLQELVQEKTRALTAVRHDLKKTLEDLRETQQRIQVMERLAALGRLVSNLAHELNNPINALENALAPVEDALEECSLSEEEEEDLRAALAIVHRSVERIRALVDTLRQGMQLPRGEPGPVSLPEVVDGALAMTAHMLKGIEVVKKYEDVRVLAHPGPLEQVFTNLIVNAVHAMEDSATKRITITITKETGMGVVTVSDTGSGIPEEILENIFEPFVTTKAPGHGTGLGLAIVHNIVSRYGGTVAVERTGPDGTTIRVELEASE